MNRVKTVLLLGALTGLIMFIGGMVGGRTGIMFAFVLVAGMNFVSYWFSDKIVLAMYRAQEVKPDQAPKLYAMVEQLAHGAGLPMPRVYIVPSATPNAFATGRNPNNAVVAVTQGILEILDERELAGVLAHEMSHIKDRDILISSIAATLAGAVMLLGSIARWSAIFGGFRGDDDDGGGIVGLLVMAILAPLAALLIQMAISRSREYLADEEGGKLAGDPNDLANALEKLDYAAGRIPMQARESTAHMFIVNPLRGKKASLLMRLFSTHPPTEERVARLRASRPSYT